MRTKIEVVAKAMYDRHAGQQDTWETLSAFWYNTYIEKAVAALEAMRPDPNSDEDYIGNVMWDDLSSDNVVNMYINHAISKAPTKDKAE